MTRRINLSELPADGRCTATSKQSGERCKQPAIRGGNVCRFHGGAAPQVSEAATWRIEAARDLAVDRIIERVQSPDDALDLTALVNAVDKLTRTARLEKGEATERTESRHVEFNAARLMIDGALDRLGEAQAQRQAVIEATDH